MPNILVRDVPTEVHAALQRRAEATGQSLQQFLQGELARLAQAPTMEQILARISGRRGGQVGLARAGRDLEAEREAR
jgi:hypothetical protein